jgi:hypothetical protein
MRTQVAILALGGVLTLGMGMAAAQDTQAPAAPPAAPQGGMHDMHRMDPERQLAHLTKELSLTSAQQDQIRPLLAERAQKMQALEQNQSLAPKDRRMQMRSISEGTQNGITAVLTDEQKQKYAAMREQMKDRMHERRGGAPEAQPAPAAQPQL